MGRVTTSEGAGRRRLVVSHIDSEERRWRHSSEKRLDGEEMSLRGAAGDEAISEAASVSTEIASLRSQ
jgi:hypothetical protein